MRTVNKHQKWQNKPLRLTEEQRKDPVLLFIDFFDSFHLHEVREILWEWMVEVVCSHRSIACEPRDRHNNIHFYEKIEALVEAALLIKKQREKMNREKETFD
jgi:hypothetical protein